MRASNGINFHPSNKMSAMTTASTASRITLLHLRFGPETNTFQEACEFALGSRAQRQLGASRC
jgi:hypothetical protein